MLRHYEYKEDLELVSAALAEFDINITDKATTFSVNRFKRITPDSFIWHIDMTGSTYLLYAEDYIEGIDQVRRAVSANYGVPTDSLEFMRVKHPEAFEDASPNRLATVYKPPEDEYNFHQYAATSGYDYVFLCRLRDESSK